MVNIEVGSLTLQEMGSVDVGGFEKVVFLVKPCRRHQETMTFFVDLVEMT